MFYRKNKKTGFTLIELLLVVSIITLISAIVISTVNETRQSARDTKRIQELVQFRNSLELYATGQNGSYPALPEGQNFINSRGAYSNTCAEGSNQNVWNNLGSSIRYEIPNDPVNDINHCYIYAVSDDGLQAGFLALSESDDLLLSVIVGNHTNIISHFIFNNDIYFNGYSISTSGYNLIGLIRE